MFIQPALPTSVHWTKIMEEVQAAAAALDQGTNLSGFVLDLLKAFNTLKWETTFMIAKQIGIPAQIIQGWRQALRGLRRTNLINGTVHGEHAASCGFPEGDPLSVFAMFLIAYCWGHWVTLTLDCTPFAFADNLEVTSGSTIQLRYSFGRVKDFCSAFGLTLSVDKCWFWSTTASGRKQIEDFTIEGVPLPLRYNATNLGATLQYSGKRSVALRKKRFRDWLDSVPCRSAFTVRVHC